MNAVQEETVPSRVFWENLDGASFPVSDEELGLVLRVGRASPAPAILAGCGGCLPVARGCVRFVRGSRLEAVAAGFQIVLVQLERNPVASFRFADFVGRVAAGEWVEDK